MKVKEWENFFNIVQKFDNLIICGDFNVQHSFWGSGKDSSEGKNFIEAWDNKVENISIINNGAQTRYA